jgi:CBS domain-containing protein
VEIELIEIRDFLAGHPPFDCLPPEVLDGLPKALSVRYLRRGTHFPPEDAGTDSLYVIRTGAVELRDPADELLERLGEGDVYASLCADDGLREGYQGTAVEDSLVYLLPCARLDTLRRQYPEVNEFFNRSVRAGLQHALRALREIRVPGGDLMNIPTGALVTRGVVQAPADVSIRNAARLMSDERVSALILMEDGGLKGLITDRDLRIRCIAEGLPTDRPVREIMTRDVHTIAADSPAFEALMTMTRLNVHHLPVTDAGGVRGLISNTDLIHYQSANAVYIAGDVRKCDDVDSLSAACRRLPELQIELIGAGANAGQLGEAISWVSDAVTVHLIELAERTLGPAPVPYVWLAVGSHARREQAAHSDQDNALLLSDEYKADEHGEYFGALARYVTEGLDACGFPYCPGNMMASNPSWRQPYHTWRGYFRRWIIEPERKALMFACNFFDIRPIHGDEELFERLRTEVLRQAADNAIFLAYLAANALTRRPPLGFFRNFVVIHGGEHDQSFDLKLRGIVPITELARVYAVSAALPDVNTADRLDAAAEAGALSRGAASDLRDALALIATLRARHQVHQIKQGVEPDNFLHPDTLSGLERGYLKDAFSVVGTLQKALAQHYQAARLF